MPKSTDKNLKKNQTKGSLKYEEFKLHTSLIKNLICQIRARKQTFIKYYVIFTIILNKLFEKIILFLHKMAKY